MGPSVHLVVEHPLFPAELEARLTAFLEAAHRRLRLRRPVSVVVLDDPRLQELHRAYIGLDEPTDVLSFPGEGEELGDVILSFDRAQEQAAQYGIPLEEEVARLAAHGLLHLAGFDDQEEGKRREMWMLQEELLSELWRA